MAPRTTWPGGRVGGQQPGPGWMSPVARAELPAPPPRTLTLVLGQGHHALVTLLEIMAHVREGKSPRHSEGRRPPRAWEPEGL